MLNDQNKQKWDKILLVTPLFGFILFGYVLTQITGNVLFVKRIGSEFLPYTYVANALIGLVAAIYVASTIGHHSVARLIRRIATVGLLIVGGCTYLIFQDIVWGYPLFLVLGQILYMLIAGIVMWDLGLKICTPLEAKQTFGFFSLGASMGGVLGGVLSSVLSERVDTEVMLIIILMSLVMVIVNSTLVQRHFSDLLALDPNEAQASHWQTIKEGFNYYRKSRLALLLSVLLLLFFSVRWIGDYEFQKILGDNFDEAQFSRISGYVSILENVGLVAMLLVIQRVIMRRLGVLHTLFASPMIVLVPFIILFFFPVYLVAMSTKVITNVINNSMFNGSIRLMFMAIPHVIRSNVTTFIGGNSESGGLLLAGAGLIVLTRILPNEWIIGIGILLTVLIAVIALFLKREYVKQVTKNLESEDLEDCHTAVENLAEPAYRELGVQELMKKIQHENLNVETVRKIVFSLGKIDNLNVVPSLLEIFKRYDITVKYAVIDSIHSFTNLNTRLEDLPFTRLNLIETYQEVFLEEGDPDLKAFMLEHLKDFDPKHVISFLKEAVESPHYQVRYQAIKTMKYFNDRGIIRYIQRFLDDERDMIRASTIIALWQFIELRPGLMRRFVELMGRNEKSAILASMSIIAKLNIHWENKFVEDKLNAQDPQVQTMASLTLLELSNLKGLPVVLHHLTRETPFSLKVAREIKQLPPKVKERLFTTIRQRSYTEIVICTQILKNTYLNFNKEISFLLGGRRGTSIAPFVQRMGRSYRAKQRPASA